MTVLCKMDAEIKHKYNPRLAGWQMKWKKLLFVYWLPEHGMNDIFASRGSPRFPGVAAFLSVIHLCEQWKAEHGTVKAITWLLLCPSIMMLFPHPLSNLGAAPGELRERWAQGACSSSLQREHDKAGRAYKPLPRQSLLPAATFL